MSTRWQIAAKLSDGRCACIYLHSDGYPSHALETLKNHYTNQEKIDRLIALGDCLGIGPEIVDCAPFSTATDSSYGEDTSPTYGKSLKAVADQHRHGDERHRYFWNGTKWREAYFS